jgi:peptidoglycan-associated lipoprotein
LRRTLIATLTVASSALLLAGCTTTQEEARTGADGLQPLTTAPQSQAQPQPLGRDAIAGVDLTAGKKDAKSMLEDSHNILAKRSVYYEYDNFEIRDEYRGIVEAHAKHLRGNPDAKMLIQGNADERGSREYNLALGQRRSDSVKRMLLLLGANENQIESVSLGKEKPVCTDHAEACWQKNRRGDMRYAGEY